MRSGGCRAAVVPAQVRFSLNPFQTNKLLGLHRIEVCPARGVRSAGQQRPDKGTHHRTRNNTPGTELAA